MAYLELCNVSKGYGPPSSRSEVLEGVDLRVEENEFVAVIGFSGSGKSTLIRLLAGLEAPDDGDVVVGNQMVFGPSPDRGIMFQSYALLPWLTSFGNVELAVKQVFPEMTAHERRDYVQHYLDLVHLTGSEAKRPRELSGGMRQRLALARTLATKPKVLLLDEPLSALDALTRAVLQDEIVRIWEEDKRTVVMITNDVDEAAIMADRIVPLTPGPKATLADAFEVELERPRNRARLNHDPRFKTLRNRITKYMIAINREAKAQRAKPAVPAPDIQPVLKPVSWLPSLSEG